MINNEGGSMEAIKKALGNAPVFVIAYILFMLPTYFLPYLGSNSAATIAIQHAAPMGTNALMWLHLAALMVLVTVTWFRGSLVDKKWLVIFPILATVFDFVPGLSLIPMVPTVMHLLAIILGVVGATAIERTTPTAPNAMQLAPSMPMVEPALPAMEDAVSFCSQCGTGVNVGDTFCESCGHRLR
jgi:hypothetical protein